MKKIEKIRINQKKIGKKRKRENLKINNFVEMKKIEKIRINQKKIAKKRK